MKELSKQFWKETSKLIDAHRKNDDERSAQGVVDSRIVFNRLVKKLTLTDVVKSSLDLKFINLLDGELCDYKVINKICNRQDDAQDVLRKVVKEHYKIDM